MLSVRRLFDLRALRPLGPVRSELRNRGTMTNAESSTGATTEGELRSLDREALVQRVAQLTEENARLKSICKQMPAPSVPPSIADGGKAADGDIPIMSTDPERKSKKRKRSDKDFCMNRYGQRMIAVKLAYLGWHFHGFATQRNAERSVEDHLFEALLHARLIESKDSCDYSRAGRTDVGVSAAGQVIGLRVRSNVVPPSTGTVEMDYVRTLNSLLPPQIRALSWVPAPDGTQGVPGVADGAELVRRPGQPFSARFDAVSRSYKYFFVRGSLDVDAMRTAVKHFEGEHDFRNFCKADVEKVTNFVRVMLETDVRQETFTQESLHKSGCAKRPEELQQWYIYVRGQAFLWHQIRCMAAVLFEIGRGHEHPDLVKQMLTDVQAGSGPFSRGKPHYQMAPPGPLLLHECEYPPSVVSFPACIPDDKRESHSSFAYADAALAGLYGTSSAHASVVRSMMESMDMFPVRSGSSGIDGRKYSDVRGLRMLLPLEGPKRHHSKNYVPFAKRQCDEPLEVKMHRVQTKKSARTESTDVATILQ